MLNTVTKYSIHNYIHKYVCHHLCHVLTCVISSPASSHHLRHVLTYVTSSPVSCPHLCHVLCHVLTCVVPSGRCSKSFQCFTSSTMVRTRPHQTATLFRRARCPFLKRTRDVIFHYCVTNTSWHLLTVLRSTVVSIISTPSILDCGITTSHTLSCSSLSQSKIPGHLTNLQNNWEAPFCYGV